MPWRHISGTGLKGWKNIKQHQYYDAYCFEATPEVEIEVYLLDYIPLNDMVGYEFRLHNSHPFVPQILDIITPQTSKETFTKVIMEHTPMRLDESSGLPNKPLEVIVAEVFLGFEAIFKQHGPFRVKQNMIGFDKKGTAKVWLNFNFAKNHMNPFDVLRANRQSVMIKNIFDVFQPFGYFLETEIATFQEGRRLVLGQITSKSIERALFSTGWKKRMEVRPKSPLSSNKKILLPPSSFTAKSKTLIENKTPQQSAQFYSAGQLQSKNKEFETPRHQNVRSSIQIREINSQDIPTFIDQLNVREYLGASINMINNKLMFISYLRQNPISDTVNDIANIFEYALEKDPDLYSFLLQIRGEIETHPSLQFQARVKKIRDLYNGVETHEIKHQVPKKGYSQHSYYATELQVEPKGIDELFESDSPRFNRVQIPTRQDDNMVQNFDKALEKFVTDKEKNRPSQNFGYMKVSPVSMMQDKPSPVPIDKRTTGISEKWQMDGNNHREQSIEERMKIKQKNFAGLKEEAAKVLGL